MNSTVHENSIPIGSIIRVRVIGVLLIDIIVHSISVVDWLYMIFNVGVIMIVSRAQIDMLAVEDSEKRLIIGITTDEECNKLMLPRGLNRGLRKPVNLPRAHG